MKKFRLEVITPEKQFFDGDIDSLVIESAQGRIGILAGHAPMAIGLKPSVLKITRDGDELIAAYGDGIVEVGQNKTTVLVISAERPEDIEMNKLTQEIEENERRMRQAQSRVEYKMSKATLTRLFAKLKAKGR